MTDFGGEQRLVGRLTAGADEQSNAWGSIAGLLGMGSESTGDRLPLILGRTLPLSHQNL